MHDTSNGKFSQLYATSNIVKMTYCYHGKIYHICFWQLAISLLLWQVWQLVMSLLLDKSWLLDKFDHLTTWQVWLLDKSDNLTSLTTWQVWQLDKPDYLTSLTTWQVWQLATPLFLNKFHNLFFSQSFFNTSFYFNKKVNIFLLYKSLLIVKIFDILLMTFDLVANILVTII